METFLLNYIDLDSCIALIPARGGSKSVPKKNIRLFKGHPLIAYSIAVARLTEGIDRVIVSTDSEEIAEISRRYGAEVPFLRPVEYAQDFSPDIDFVKHAICWLYENEGKIPRYFVHLRPTSPIRDPKVVMEAVKRIKEDENATSLRSGYLCVHPPYKWFRFEGSYMRPLISGMSCDEVNLPRQDFPKVLVPNGYVDVLKTDFIIREELMHGERMLGFITEEVPDIDTEADLRKLDLCQDQQMIFEQLHRYLERLVL